MPPQVRFGSLCSACYGAALKGLEEGLSWPRTTSLRSHHRQRSLRRVQRSRPTQARRAGLSRNSPAATRHNALVSTRTKVDLQGQSFHDPVENDDEFLQRTHDPRWGVYRSASRARRRSVRKSRHPRASRTLAGDRALPASRSTYAARSLPPVALLRHGLSGPTAAHRRHETARRSQS